MSRHRCAGVLLCIAVLVTAGCSGDDDDNSSSAKTTTSDATTSTTAATDTTVPATDSTTVSPGGPASNTLPAVGVGTEADLGGNAFVTVTKIEPTNLTANAPGEVSGPGVFVTVDVRNATDKELDLAGLVVNAHYGDGTPAVPAALQRDALSGTVAPGESKSGVYAFSVPADQNSSVVVDVQHSSFPNVVIIDAIP
jgi:hypothetical protein